MKELFIAPACLPSFLRGRPHRSASLLAALLWLASLAGMQGTVLDNFSGAKTGWTVTLNIGSVSQSAGQFIVATATNSGALTYSMKTSATFTNQAAQTLDFRVDVNAVTPGNADP